jgi:diadenosine tetraphosphate (Ap4A) HIT family hydrolase
VTVQEVPGRCIFCDIVAGRAPASIVYRDEWVCAFMDIQPVNPGHLLVIPVTHAPDLAALEPDTGAQMFRVGQQLAKAIRRNGVPCEGINFFLADGEAAGQEVFHVHLHVFPRYAGDGFGLRYGPKYDVPPDRSALEATASAVRGALGGIDA